MLDIGAGPHWSWTDLALKLTRTPDSSHKGTAFFTQLLAMT